MRMGDIVERQVVPFIFVLPVAFITYLLAAAAGGQAAPFDLLEADSEIVAGYFIEYSGLKFGWFYIAEYGNLFAISAITTTLFLGGWRGRLLRGARVGAALLYHQDPAVIFLLMWIRGTWPRFRIDQMLAFAWKVLVPASLANLLWSAIVLQVAASRNR